MGALVFNAVLGLGYRIYRLTKGGPVADVIGQAVLALVLVSTAGAVAMEASFARWVALGYGITFGVVVMPVWVLAVLIPMRPTWVDYTFTTAYWAALATIIAAALAV